VEIQFLINPSRDGGINSCKFSVPQLIVTYGAQQLLKSRETS